MTNTVAGCGEVSLIQRITRGLIGRTDEDLLVGVGDDCAVLRRTNEEALLITTDMLVQDEHFSLDWSSPYQVGLKAAEANLSDIAAMGGSPGWAFTSIALPGHVQVHEVEQIYQGMRESFDRHGVTLAGGDTTAGPCLILNVCVLGVVPPGNVRRRSHARVGDLVGVSGHLGKSRAGLELLRAGRGAEGSTTAYVEPRCRLDLVPCLAPRVHAMIDVSDGLASEVRHICEMSQTGVEVLGSRLPISASTRAAASLLGQDPLAWALSGGEDFELVFTAPPEVFDALAQEGADITRVGRILPGAEGLWLVRGGAREELPRGFEHFSR